MTTLTAIPPSPSTSQMNRLASVIAPLARQITKATVELGA
jgi:hypothetical protein